MGDSSETSSKASTCSLKVEGGDVSKCKAGTCADDMCDNDAWANSIAEKYQALSPLSFKLKSTADVVDAFTQGKPHMVKFVDFINKKIKAKWEAAVTASSNVELDTSQCEAVLSGTVSTTTVTLRMLSPPSQTEQISGT